MYTLYVIFLISFKLLFCCCLGISDEAETLLEILCIKEKGVGVISWKEIELYSLIFAEP